MKIARSQSELEDAFQSLRQIGKTIAFVPTMGALHEGHLSLVTLALERADYCVVSIYVNPTQFAPHEDFDSYPRMEDEDLKKLAQAGAHLVYLPRTEELYPDGIKSERKAGKAAQGLEADFRPTHFDGVVTIVGRLFDHVKPGMAVFGEKDYQQLCVLKEAFGPTKPEIIGAPIKRDADGLALSSRNQYLSPDELKVAQMLNKTLYFLADEIRDFPQDVDELIPLGIQTLLDLGFNEVDYLSLRQEHTLAPLNSWNRKPARLLVAAHLGKTRLIDNVGV